MGFGVPFAGGPMKAEKIKSAVLVFLFVFCIFLTGELIVGLSISQSKLATKPKVLRSAYEIKKIFNPQSYIVSFGGGIYTKNAYDENVNLWKEAQKNLTEAFLQIKTSSPLSSLDQEKWEVRSRDRGAYFRLPFSVSLRELISFLDMEILVNQPKVSIDGILFSTSCRECIYFADEKNQLYYQMKVPIWTENLLEIIDRIENKEIVEYRRIEDLFGLDKQKNTRAEKTMQLFPVTSMKIGFVNVTPEFRVDSEYETVLKSYANKAFGQNFNFVKKMKDVDGSVIYIYGYANKALRLGADGSIEYTQRLDHKQRGTEQSLKSALKLALTYIDQYGGIPESLYLANYEKKTDQWDNVVYVFDFDYRMRQVPVIYDRNYREHGIHVEIVGEQAIQISRKVYRFKNQFSLDVWPRALTVNEVLDKNSRRIQDDYLSELGDQENFSTSALWLKILSNISHVGIGYYLEKDDIYLHPVWQIQIGKSRYRFRLYDGKDLSI